MSSSRTARVIARLEERADLLGRALVEVGVLAIHAGANKENGVGSVPEHQPVFTGRVLKDATFARHVVVVINGAERDRRDGHPVVGTRGRFSRRRRSPEDEGKAEAECVQDVFQWSTPLLFPILF